MSLNYRCVMLVAGEPRRHPESFRFRFPVKNNTLLIMPAQINKFLLYENNRLLHESTLLGITNEKHNEEEKKFTLIEVLIVQFLFFVACFLYAFTCIHSTQDTDENELSKFKAQTNIALHSMRLSVLFYHSLHSNKSRQLPFPSLINANVSIFQATRPVQTRQVW